jgi:MoxR-like ATPase
MEARSSSTSSPPSRGFSATSTVEVAQRIRANVERVLEGKREVIELAVASLLARGHLLIEDVPGVGKTTLARALAASVGLDFRRIQFTSDLMPADVLGGSIYSGQTGQFTFRKGPVFTNVLLADEINRTTPKTQSALLEAMGEHRVSIDGETHILPEPFFVLATQNPEEFYGTYPLPESQLDRFLMRLRIGYPPQDVERQVLARRRIADPIDDLEPVASERDLLATQEAVDRVRTTDDLLDYLHSIVLATRSTPLLSIGVSTRGALALERAVRAYALVLGRSYAIPDDVKAVAVAVLAHRVRASGARDGVSAASDGERVIRELLASLPVPV